MQCPRCHQENRAEVRFCEDCGAPLAVNCPSCGAALTEGKKFCGACGQPVHEHAGLLASSARSPRVSEAERRQITVMFCDLVGSTALSERLDPEELREVIQGYQQACAGVIERFDGHIAQYLGDGLLVYFGYPQAHEDDAQRAVRAGLGIIEAIERLPPGREGARLAVRVGIHTGPVVVGEVGGGGRHEQLALGETPNLAARLQSLADPNHVVVSATTHRLVEGFFLTRDLGPRALKGVSAPVRVFEMTGESAARSRLDVVAPVGLTPLVGREQEIGLLLDRWEQVAEGHGQVVLLTGEPGIGKSRLVQVLKDRSGDSPYRRLECRCSPYYAHTPLYPLMDLLPRLFDWSREEVPEARFAKLEKGLAETGATLGETIPLLASLLSLPAPAGYPLPPMSPERQKQKTLEALVGFLVAMATREPVLLIVEDLHWVDPTTLELLTMLIDQVPTAGLLVLLTARPSFASPWPPRSHLIPLTLTRFARRQTETMVKRVAGGKTLPAEVLRQIVTRTDGVPLFVEELTKMVLESGLLREAEDRYELTGPLPPLAIPTTLQDSLMARLDRLAEVKEAAQLGAAIGRAFPYALIRAVATLDEPTLQRELRRLVEAELLYQRGAPPEATYIFKHALIQEAAYQSLLKSRRQHYHHRIARTMVEQFPTEAEERPEFVAHHYTEAGLNQHGAEYWQRAGERAVHHSHAEGIRHFGKALEVLAACPESLERDQRELALQTALGFAFVPAKGWSVPEAERAFTRARVLTQRIPDAPLLFGALWGLMAFHAVRADHRTAREFAEQSAAVAERAQDPDLLLEAYFNLGASSFWRGEFTAARDHVERSISLYDRKKHRAHAFVYGQDPCVASLAFLSWAFWSLGYPEQAMRRVQENLALARGLSHPFSLAWALTFKGFVCLLRREWREAQLAAEENVALSTEQGFPYWLATARAQRGLALAKQGQPELGIAQLKQALLAQRADGVGLQGPILLGWLANACACAGQVDEGLGVLEEALTVIEKTGERLVESEIWRLRGEISLIRAGPDAPHAGPYFRRAIEIARTQEAKSSELRAATSLSRLWQRLDKRAEARQLLGEIYGWFTEGFETADLKEAKALLTELS